MILFMVEIFDFGAEALFFFCFVCSAMDTIDLGTVRPFFCVVAKRNEIINLHV